MIRSQSETRANQPQRLINRLSRHWAHKFTVEQTDGQSRIDFGNKGCLLKVIADGLSIEAWSEPDQMTALEEAIADHLQRSADAGETLQFVWKRNA